MIPRDLNLLSVPYVHREYRILIEDSETFIHSLVLGIDTR